MGRQYGRAGVGVCRGGAGITQCPAAPRGLTQEVGGLVQGQVQALVALPQGTVLLLQHSGALHLLVVELLHRGAGRAAHHLDDLAAAGCWGPTKAGFSQIWASES